MMHQWAKRPPDIKTSVTYLRSRHWQHELIQSHEHLDLIPIFRLPRGLVMDFLINWLTIDTLCVFDTAICQRDSRRFLIQDIFLDGGFIYPSNKLERLLYLPNSRQRAVFFARWLHIRQIYVRVFDFFV